jgi:aminoglycoside phosphotransferase (APT) family kinase protein
LFADLQIGLHACVVKGMPSQRQRLEERIDGVAILSRGVRDALIRTLHDMPDGDRLCHGDFHPDNVLLDADGPTIIDWADATRGNPWADVAQTTVLFDVAQVPVGTPRPWLVDMFRWLFQGMYRHRYAALRPAGRESLAVWRPIVAAARLADCPPAECEGLLAVVEGRNGPRPSFPRRVTLDTR